jgi:myo-inositol 2-dehydrogenase/D-chiro-inositol 1-dehydrogenase
MHARNLGALTGLDELVLHDPVPGRAQAVAAKLAGTQVALRTVDDFGHLLAGVDGLVVATPTTTHADLVLGAVAAGVPTLCEKPAAADEPRLREVVDAVERAGVEVLVGFQRRFDPALVEMRRQVLAGELGVVYHVRALGQDHEPPDAGFIPTSGGMFRDLFIHDLDAVPWLVDEPVVEVYATGSVLVDQAFAASGDVDTAVAVLRFASGALATLTGGRRDGLGYDHRIEVIGSRGALVTGLDDRTPLTSLEPSGPRSRPDAYRGFSERFAVAYAAEAAAFVEVVAGRAANPSPVRDSLVSVVLANACEHSRAAGSPVQVPESTTFLRTALSPEPLEKETP